MKGGENTSLIDLLEDRYSKKLREIYIVGKLEEKDENYQQKIGNKLPGKANTNVKRFERNYKREKDKLIEHRSEGDNKKNYYSLTEEGRRFYNVIRPLFIRLSDIKDFVEDFRSKNLRYPDREEIEDNIGRSLTETELKRLDILDRAPDDRFKEKKAEELFEIIVWYVADNSEKVESNGQFISVFKEKPPVANSSRKLNPENISRPDGFNNYCDRNEELLDQTNTKEGDHGFLVVHPPDEINDKIGGRFWISP